MTNQNEELLSWAVENIKEWEEGWPLLMSDSSEYSASVFYTKVLGDWKIGYDYWCDKPGAAFYPVDTGFYTNTPQVITKEEWEAATAAKNAPTSSPEPIQGHIHADLMAEYALVAKTNPEPWREFEVLNSEAKGWEDLEMNPRWFAYAQYRRKPTPPKTMNIGGVIVEAWPLDHMPSAGLSYWALVVEDDAQFSTAEFINDVDNIDEAILYTGKAFSTKEQAQAVADALNLVYNRAIGKE